MAPGSNTALEAAGGASQRAVVSAPPKITDIARAAGVSISTVSRALHNAPNVRPEVRERVRQAAAKLDYRPHPLVSALMHQIRAHRKSTVRANLAYLDWCVRREDFSGQSVQRRFFAGAKRAAHELGYALEEFFPFADGLGQATLMRMLEARGMRGAVVFIHARQDPVTRDALDPRTATEALPVDFTRLSTVALGGRFAAPSPHFATNDQYAAGRLVGETLLARGYRRPGLALSNYLDTITENRFHAGLHSVWSRSAHASGLRSLVYREGDGAALVGWVRAERIDVLAACADQAPRWLSDAGLRVPRDLGFVSLDAEPGGPIAGVDQRHEEVAHAAVSLVVEQLNRNECGLPSVPRGVLIEGVWVDGPTLAARQGA